MKICIPVETSSGMKSLVYGHFGSAPYFAIYDMETIGLEIMKNDDAHHSHGMCHPLGSLDGKSINAVICGGMGMRAIGKLNEAGIKAFRASSGTVEDTVRQFSENKLEEITTDGACGAHGCH